MIDLEKYFNWDDGCYFYYTGEYEGTDHFRKRLCQIYSVLFSIILITLHIITMAYTNNPDTTNHQTWSIFATPLYPAILYFLLLKKSSFHKKRKFKIIEKDNEYIVGVKFILTYYVVANKLYSIEEATNRIEEIKTHAKSAHEKTIIKKRGIIRK